MTTSSIDRAIGSRLRKRRIESAVDKATLAKQIGRTEAQIDSYEGGRLRIDPKSMLLLCRELRVNVRYFFEPWTKNAPELTAPVLRVAAE